MKPIEIIKKYRKLRHVTQSQVADLLNIKANTYNTIENGKTYLKADDFIKLLQYLDIPVNELSEDEFIIISKEELEKLNKSVEILNQITKSINEKANTKNETKIYCNKGVININNNK